MKVVFNSGMRALGLFVVAGAAALACSAGDATPPAPDAGTSQQAEWASRLQTFQLNVAAAGVDTTFDVANNLRCGVEMQLSGEPFAETMGRVLADFSRDHLPTNIYFDPTIPGGGGRVDLVGFSTAVESYEYSKQQLNNVGLESGAGLSSAFGPVTNPSGLTGVAAEQALRGLVQSFGAASNKSAAIIRRPPAAACARCGASEIKTVTPTIFPSTVPMSGAAIRRTVGSISPPSSACGILPRMMGIDRRSTACLIGKN